MLARCIAESFVGGGDFAVDGSLTKADANRQRGVDGAGRFPPESVDHAAQEYLASTLAVLDDAAFGAATLIVPEFISGRSSRAMD